MKIKNNRKHFVALQYKVGVRKEIARIKPSEMIDLPHVTNMSQIVNKFLFNSGHLSVVAGEVAEFKPKTKDKKDTSKKATEKKKTKKSKVDKAIESTEDFVKSSKNKNKNEEK